MVEQRCFKVIHFLSGTKWILPNESDLPYVNLTIGNNI